MAKTKQTTQKKTGGAERVRTSVYLEERVHKALRMYAASKDVFIADAANDLIAESLLQKAAK